MFSHDDDDDDDFVKGAGSKLANLFGNDHSMVTPSSQSLMYTPPKQPKKIDIPGNSSAGEGSTPSMILMHAAAVTAYKYDNQKYLVQGKLGAAILGNHESGVYKIIFYTGKQQHVTYATVTDKFQFICQPNLYGSFYDDNRQSWSILFESSDSQSQFCKNLALCKANYLKKDNVDKIIVQDLIMTNENTSLLVEENDMIEIKYKGWAITERENLGKLFDDSENSHKKPLRLSLDKKNGGKWLHIFNGMKIGSKRFAIIPYKMKDQYNEITDRSPMNQILMFGFEFEVLRIKPRKDSIPEQAPVLQKLPTKESVEIKTAEHDSTVSRANEESSQKEASKSNILSRVARMGGMQILPGIVKKDLEPEESVCVTKDTQDSRTFPQDAISKPLPKPRSNSQSNGNKQVTDQHIVSDLTSQQLQHTLAPSQFGAVPLPAQFINSFSNFDVSGLLNETRTNNTEIRLSLGKVFDKLDNLLEKVNDIKNASGSSNLLPLQQTSSFSLMDSALLLSTIQRIVNENSNYKKELEDKNLKLHTLNEKICDLLKNQTSVINNQNFSEEIERLRSNESKIKQELNFLSNESEKLKSEKLELVSENSLLKEKIETLKLEIENFDKAVKVETEDVISRKRVKKMMNELYKTFASQMQQNASYQSSQVLPILIDSIKTTLIAFEGSNGNSKCSSQKEVPTQSFDEIDKEPIKNELIQTEVDPSVKEPCEDDAKCENAPIPPQRSGQNKSK